MKIVSWNVNSINARIEHLIKFINKDKADIYLIQELKSTNENFPYELIKSAGYNAIVNGQKAWNGVAILSKKPLKILENKIPTFKIDEQARFIETEIKISKIKQAVKLFNIYLPNGNPIDTTKFDYKIEWMKKFNKYILDLYSNNIPMIIGGDFNVIPTDEDVYSPENYKNDACAHPKTREQFRILTNSGLTDTVKYFIEGKTNWTFWGYRGGSWQKGNGIRIDHLLTSPEVTDLIKLVRIDRTPRGWEKASDHTPVILEITN
jgi:exodeoxyribonuclease-3